MPHSSNAWCSKSENSVFGCLTFNRLSDLSAGEPSLIYDRTTKMRRHNAVIYEFLLEWMREWNDKRKIKLMCVFCNIWILSGHMIKGIDNKTNENGEMEMNWMSFEKSINLSFDLRFDSAYTLNYQHCILFFWGNSLTHTKIQFALYFLKIKFQMHQHQTISLLYRHL